jgi:hypothetical protein
VHRAGDAKERVRESPCRVLSPSQQNSMIACVDVDGRWSHSTGASSPRFGVTGVDLVIVTELMEIDLSRVLTSKQPLRSAEVRGPPHLP